MELTKEIYARELEQELTRVPMCIREPIDDEIDVDSEIIPMGKPDFTCEEVHAHISKMKNKNASGPDVLKAELYKALVQTQKGLQTLTECLKREFTSEEKPASWITSKTRMIPKKSKPTAKDLCPIALTNNSYKLFMSLIKGKSKNI